RGQLLSFLATLPPCTVALEACGSAHYWGREIAKLGHTVILSKLFAESLVNVRTLLAKWSGGQGSEAGGAGGGERAPGEPSREAVQVEGCRGGHVLQARFDQTPIARSAQAKGAHAL